MANPSDWEIENSLRKGREARYKMWAHDVLLPFMLRYRLTAGEVREMFFRVVEGVPNYRDLRSWVESHEFIEQAVREERGESV